VSEGSGLPPAFGLVGPGGELLAGPGSAAANEVDLLTVLEHELGHVLGLPDNAETGDLMDITLGLGVRRAPSRADLAAVNSSSTATDTANAKMPLPASVVPLSQPNPLSGPMTPATVDAVLASMLGSTGQRSGLRITNPRKAHVTQPSLRHPEGALWSRFASRWIAAAIKQDEAR
jgi:hypothetical protein